MKNNNVIYTNKKELESFIVEKSIKDSNLLVQIFSGTLEEERISEVIKTIKNQLPNSIIIGATTAGEIIADTVLDNSIVISFCEFDATSLKSFSVDYTSDDYSTLGKEIGNALIDKDTKALIVFSNTLHANREDLLKGIEEINPNVIVAGGVSGDNFAITGGRVFLNEKIISEKNGIVAVSLNSETLRVYSTYSLGWQAIGKKMKVTKSEGAKVYTLDNEPTFSLYKKYLGQEIADNMMNFAGAEFPIIVERDGVKIAREAITANIEDGSVIYSGKIYEGEEIQFGYGNANFILQNVETIEKELESVNLEGIFIYSCAARKAFLKNSVLSEIKLFKKYGEVSGFFTYGEFFHLNNRNETLNMTMTILAISEEKLQTKKISTESKDVKSYYDKNSMANIRALTHLVDVVTKEVEEKNQILIEKNMELEEKNQNIMESILYAQTIQDGILPKEDKLKINVEDCFIIWKPAYTVGGDFYWYKALEDSYYLAIVDCTGHGVPGALMTMTVNSILNRIVEGKNKKLPSQILNELNLIFKDTINSNKFDLRMDNGLDIGICHVFPKQNKLIYAGAANSLYYSDENNKAIRVKGNTRGVGYIRSKDNIAYENFEITKEQNRVFYLTTDGYMDQNGGENNRALGRKGFEEIIKEISLNSLDKQKEEFENRLKNHMGTEKQRDDITILAFKI